MEKQTVRKKREKAIVVLPELNVNENYLFEFNNKVPEKQLRGTRELISGELVLIFIKQGYGVLC
jgi:hypothetical protein